VVVDEMTGDLNTIYYSDETSPKWDITFYPISVEHEFRKLFYLASYTFDKQFYKHGKRWTVKDNLHHGNTNPLGRHNMLHFNFIIQHLTLLCGGLDYWRFYQTSTFFPLLKTETVLDELQYRWKFICMYQSWIYWDLREHTPFIVWSF
jgi:hypothetical protein